MEYKKTIFAIGIISLLLVGTFFITSNKQEVQDDSLILYDGSEILEPYYDKCSNSDNEIECIYQLGKIKFDYLKENGV